MRVLTTTCFGLTCGTSSGCKIRLDKLYYNAWENIIWSRGVLRGTMVPFYICLVLLRSLPAVVCLSGMSKPRQGGGPGHNGMKRMQQDRSTSSLKSKDSHYIDSFLWTSYRPVAETGTWKHNTHNRHPWTRRDSNPQSQQASGCMPLLSPHDHRDRLCCVYKDTNIRHLFIRNHNASYMFRPLRSLPQAVHDCIKKQCTVQLTTLLTSSVFEVNKVWDYNSFPPYGFIVSSRPSCTTVTDICRHLRSYIRICIANSYIHANEKCLIHCCKRHIETLWTACSWIL